LRNVTYSVLSLLLTSVLAGTASGTAAQDAPQPSREQPAAARIANPASQNCIRHGGTLLIRKRTDGGEYGICLFASDHQCEEWAMLRGDCPTGGVRIAGYVTPAAQFCVITGGSYAVTGNQGLETEQGTCTFMNGKKCDVWGYFEGGCVPNE
jgi:putative hemolysin